MWKLHNTGESKAAGARTHLWAKRAFSLFLALVLMTNISSFIPTPAPAVMVANSDSVEYGESSSQLFSGIANGTVMDDGSVLIHYGVWDLAGMYEAAVETDRYFRPEMIADALPFESDEVKAEFIAKYGDGWYLVDAVYSKKLLPDWPECAADMTDAELDAFAANSSLVCAVSQGGALDVQFIVMKKSDEVFNIYVDVGGAGTVKADIVEYVEEIIETAAEPTTREALPDEETLPDGAGDEANDAGGDGAAEPQLPSGQPSEGQFPGDPAATETPTLPAEQTGADQEPTTAAAPATGDSAGDGGAADAEYATLPADQSAVTTLPAEQPEAATLPPAEQDGAQALPGDSPATEAPAAQQQAPITTLPADQAEAVTLPAPQDGDPAASGEAAPDAGSAQEPAGQAAPADVAPATAAPEDSATAGGAAGAGQDGDPAGAAPAATEAAPAQDSAEQADGQGGSESGLVAFIESLYIPAAYAQAEPEAPATVGGESADSTAPEQPAAGEPTESGDSAAPGATDPATQPQGDPSGDPAGAESGNTAGGEIAGGEAADGQGAAGEPTDMQAAGAETETAPADETAESVADEPALEPEAPADGAETIAKLVENPLELNLELDPIAGKVEIAGAQSAVTIVETKVLPDEPETESEQAQAQLLQQDPAQAIASMLREAVTTQPAAYADPADTAATAIKDGIVYLPVNMYDYLGMQAKDIINNNRSLRGTFNDNAYLNTDDETGFGEGATGNYNYNYNSNYVYFGKLTLGNGSNTLGNQNKESGDSKGANATIGIASSSLSKVNGEGKYEFSLAGNLRTFSGRDAAGNIINSAGNNGSNLFPNAEVHNDMIDAYVDLQFPFLLEDGYYTFDSDNYHVFVEDAISPDGVGYSERKMALYRGMQTTKRTGLQTGGGWFPFNEKSLPRGTGNNNVFFGMRMDIPFVMPPEGRLPNGEEMLYKFTGDDDIWIYIDGKLVLDMGGIHGKVVGTINFATGKVTVERVLGGIDPNNPTNDLTNNAGDPVTNNTSGGATVRELLYWNLYKIEEGTAEETGPYTDSENKTYVYAGNAGIVRTPYKECDLSVFYMERGGDDSNCYMKFNLPVYEPDKLNVFKLAEQDISDSEVFSFDVYKADSKPSDDDFNAMAPVVTETIRKGMSFAVDIGEGTENGQWVRIVEQANEYGGDERFSTMIIRDSGSPIVGKDSGWFWCDFGATKSLFCFNYTQIPIELTKYRLDGAVWNGEDVVCQTMEGVSFTLHMEDSLSQTGWTQIGGTLITGEAGKLYFNDRYREGSPAIQNNKTYKLVETSPPDNYEAAPDIYFSTTDGASPRVNELWYYEGNVVQGANKIYYSNEDEDEDEDGDGDEGYGQIAFASENGREIRVYNERITGSVTLKKTITDANDYLQGDPIFLFKVEKLAVEKDEHDNNVPGDRVLGTRTAHVRFDSNSGIADPASVTVDGLEAGYFYRVSELATMRYRLGAVSIESDGDIVDDVDSSDSTVTFLLTGDDAQNEIAIAVTFENDRIYENYLSDTDVSSNRFDFAALWPDASEPDATLEITIMQGTTNIATHNVMNGDLLNLSALGGTTIYVWDDGSIGTMNGERFYPHTIIRQSGIIRLHAAAQP